MHFACTKWKMKWQSHTPRSSQIMWPCKSRQIILTKRSSHTMWITACEPQDFNYSCNNNCDSTTSSWWFTTKYLTLLPAITFSLWKSTIESTQKSSLQFIAIVSVTKTKFCIRHYRYLGLLIFLFQLLPNTNELVRILLFWN